jgi:polyhydroxyalkanoate synthesis regulator protein
MPIEPRDPEILVKRYTRSRLYDTAAGRYLTVNELRDWAARGVRFPVEDTETGEDLTRVTGEKR